MSHPVDAYAQVVMAGAVPAGKYHRLSCARHLRDRSREGSPEFPYRFEADRADRFFRFSRQLKHYKGEWASTCPHCFSPELADLLVLLVDKDAYQKAQQSHGRRPFRYECRACRHLFDVPVAAPIVLQPYQLFRLGSIFGWVHVETGLRRFRAAYNEIPRKNGKSLEAAVVALYVTFFDNEPGAEGYCIATKREQAKIVFEDAKKLVESSGLKSRIAVQVANLHRDASASKLEPLGADHDSTDGLNPNLIVTDEFHAHKTRGLIDVMETATGARRQPLHFQITTAGDNESSPCGDQHDYACQILDEILEDETFFAFIAHADVGDEANGVPPDDWLDERTWQKANPNWGVTVKPDDMRSLARKAAAMPAAAATFKQKRLNLWVNSSTPWLSIEGWKKGQRTDWRFEDLAGETCFVGIDLASKLDLCALVFVFPPTESRSSWRLVPRVWTPKDTLIDRARRDRAKYDVWADQGWLTAVPGTSLDHDALIRPVLVAARDQVTIARIGFDPWHAGTAIKNLVSEDGFSEDQVLEIPQTFAHLSAASLAFEAAVLAGQVDAMGSPLMTWCAGNAVVQRDGKDNIQPIKKRSRGRIDPIVASVIGMSSALRLIETTVSVYEERGLTEITWGNDATDI